MKNNFLKKSAKNVITALTFATIISSTFFLTGCDGKPNISNIKVSDIYDDFNVIGSFSSTPEAYKSATSQTMAVFDDCVSKAKAKGEKISEYMSNHELCKAIQVGFLGLGENTRNPSDGAKYLIKEMQKIQNKYT